MSFFIFQDSAWMWSDGSPISYVNWGFTYPYPDLMGYEMLDKTTWPHKSPKENTETSSLLQCSAFRIFPDHSHVTMFPINCSTKRWSKILCSKKETIANGEYNPEGYGEYWVHNKTLLQRNYICPSGFAFKIEENFCIFFYWLINQVTNTIP